MACKKRQRLMETQVEEYICNSNDHSVEESEYSSEEENSDGDGGNEIYSNNSDSFSDDNGGGCDCVPSPTSTRERHVTASGEIWGWSRMEDAPEIFHWTEISTIYATILGSLGENCTVLDVNSKLMSEDFWEHISTETNRYAMQQLSDTNYKKKRYDDKWVDTTPDEMKAYFALCILMTQVKKSKVRLNWSKRAVIETPIYGKTMSFVRFHLISRFLHFQDNEAVEKDDGMWKIRYVIDYLNHKFQNIYSSMEEEAVDGSIVNFKGRLACMLFNPTKRAQFNNKVYKLCESASGYCVSFRVYKGQDVSKESDLTPSESVVLELGEPIFDKGYTLHLDNWYLSPNLSLMHKAAIMTDTGRARITEVQEDSVFKPDCVLDYNRGVGSVNRQDQTLACFPIMRKFVKGYRKIFFYIMDIAVYNAYIIYWKIQEENGHPGRRRSFVDFRVDLAEQLLESVTLPDYNRRGRPSQGDNVLRLQSKTWGHFPRRIPSTVKKLNPTRVCKVCAAHKKRSETTWECEQCLVALHIPECFKMYHTLTNY